MLAAGMTAYAVFMVWLERTVPARNLWVYSTSGIRLAPISSTNRL